MQPPRVATSSEHRFPPLTRWRQSRAVPCGSQGSANGRPRSGIGLDGRRGTVEHDVATKGCWRRLAARRSSGRQRVVSLRRQEPQWCARSIESEKLSWIYRLNAERTPFPAPRSRRRRKLAAQSRGLADSCVLGTDGLAGSGCTAAQRTSRRRRSAGRGGERPQALTLCEPAIRSAGSE